MEKITSLEELTREPGEYYRDLTQSDVDHIVDKMEEEVPIRQDYYSAGMLLLALELTDFTGLHPGEVKEQIDGWLENSILVGGKDSIQKLTEKLTEIRYYGK